MCAAFSYAFYMCQLMDTGRVYKFDHKFIQGLAGYVMHHPYKSMEYRHIPVHFADNSFAPNWLDVPRLMTQLVTNQQNITPEEYYQEFERIHPFEDGNGRVGAILYNMLMKTMEDPIAPPAYTGKTILSN